MMKTPIITICLGMGLLMAAPSRAQYSSIGTPLNTIRELYVDSVTQRLYITFLGDTFDGKHARSMVYHDLVTGITDTLPDYQTIVGGGIASIIRIDSLLYWGGGMAYYDSNNTYQVNCHVRYNGQQWYLNDSNYCSYMDVNVMYYDGVNFYMGGDGQSPFAGQSNNNIVGRNLSTGTWFALPLLDMNGGGRTNDIIRYQGDLIVGGNLTVNFAAGIKDLLKLSGNSWVSLGGGFQSSSEVTTLMEYNGLLIVAGGGLSFGTVPGDKIAAWDGTQWIDMNYPLPGGIIVDMAELNGELYAVGTFPAPNNTINFARWDGAQWHDCNFNITGGGSAKWVYDVAAYDSAVYIGGLFPNINGLPIESLAKYIPPPVSVAELSTPVRLQAYPNPARGQVKLLCPVKWEGQMLQSNIYTVTGQKVATSGVKVSSGRCTIALEGVKSGIYIVQLKGAGISGHSIIVVK